MSDILIRRRPVPADTAGLAALHPVLRRVYAARAIRGSGDLECGLADLHDPALLRGCAEAAALLHETMVRGGRIVVIGDFDADGATSCALALRALRAMGAKDVGYLIPNRFDCGHGLSPEIVAEAARQRPALIVTVDHGISSLEGVEAANAFGIPVLITDHHLPGPTLPRAAAIVNPNQPGDTFPSKHLAGVGVIFYVMLALRRRLRDAGWLAAQGRPEPRLADLLDLVALGTVADVVPLDANNRILVAQGIARIRRGRCAPGIRALVEVAGRRWENLTAADLGFVVGPRLNAAGRLEDMSVGVECLLADDEARARARARQLDDLNRERRRIEGEMKEQALALLGEAGFEAPSARDAVSICLYHQSWHQGVIGILASRIREKTHRPTICFAPAGGGELRGSARSVAGLHVRDCLEAIAVREPRLIPKFGGHAMAAGLSLREADFAAFSRAFEAEVGRRLSPEDLHGVIHTDGELAPEDLCLDLARQLRDGGPWGPGFPEPLFDGLFQVRERRVVGERHLRLRLSPLGSDVEIDAIAFNQTPVAEPGTKLRLAYRLDVNEFRGRLSAQLVVEHVAFATSS